MISRPMFTSSRSLVAALRLGAAGAFRIRDSIENGSALILLIAAC